MPIEHLHPIAVHFPIVLIIALFAVDFVASLRGAEITGRTGPVATATMLIAVAAGIFAILAVILGDLAAEIAIGRGVAQTVADALETHEGFGTVTGWLIALWGAVRLFLWWKDKTIGARWIVWLVDLVLIALIITTAWFGGNLVFEYGVNVSTAM